MANHTNNGANLGFESELWRAADAMRSNMDAAEYKHVVLGLICVRRSKSVALEGRGNSVAF
jgi:type I restriction enzyme M protein